jgi:hypothetical protein
MPASLKSLTKAQQRTLTFLVSTVVLLGAAGWLVHDVNRRVAQAASERQEIERKENTARENQPASAEEQASWIEQSQRLQALLLSDQTLPQFYTEITTLAGENGLDQRFGMTPEEKAIREDNPSTEESKILSVGVRRYVVLTLNFRGDYPNVSRFLGALSRLPRAIEFQTIDMRREGPLVEVSLVLHVYRREEA